MSSLVQVTLVSISHVQRGHAALNMGYGDLDFFHRAFRRQIGCSPTEYRRRFWGRAAWESDAASTKAVEA